MYLPGIGRIQARPFSMRTPGGEFGRLCYNENPLGPSPLALEALHQSAARANRYPEWFSSGLEALIAAEHGVPSSWICVGTGATEIIHLIAEAFLGPGDELVTATPTYSQMGNEAIANGATVVHVPVDDNHFIDIEAISNAITPQTRLVSLVNANNPLGNCLDKTALENFIDSLPGGDGLDELRQALPGRGGRGVHPRHRLRRARGGVLPGGADRRDRPDRRGRGQTPQAVIAGSR